MGNETRRIKAATIGVYHQDCQTSTSTEKFPGITLEQVSPVIYLSRKPDKVNYQLLWQVNANSPSELDEYLAYIKKNQNTKSLTVLQKGKQNALILLRFMSPTSSYDKIIESGVVNTSPVVAREGLETYKILSSDPGSIKKALKGLSDVGDIKIKKIGNFGDDDSGIPRLTSKQVEALQLALQSNYYYWPREATLEQLAASAKISRRSMQERLRRAETKLFPFAIKEFLKKKM